MTYPITGHMVVANEDQFIWYAISSVLPYLEKLIIYDTGSTDKTVEIIKSIDSHKIIFEEKGKVIPDKLVELRREQIKKTKNLFFLLVDGDEIWSDKNVKRLCETAINMPEDKLAIFCRTRNAVGDIYHYLPENAGQYQLQGRKGHFNIRLFRKRPDINIVGKYPLEAYTYDGQPINKLDDNLLFSDVWYLHATHLVRSSRASSVAGPSRQSKIKYELGNELLPGELPEVFSLPRPKTVPDPLAKQSVISYLRAVLETPLRRWKRKIV